MKTEKLNALADEAGFEITPWGNESLPCVHQEGPIDVELKKFAKLIVRECTNFLKDTLDEHFAAEQLEEHFGVEE